MVIFLMNAYRHFVTITTHRRFVRRHCFEMGLFRQGLLHDLTKYSPTEFLVGAKYFQGDRSPNNAEREATGKSLAWLHHKGRNKHHLEYWIDYDYEQGGCMAGMEMPVNYVVEMFCDRVAACQIYQRENYTQASAWEYYNKSKKNYMIHPETAALLEKLLLMLRDDGEEVVIDYIRRELLKNKR